MDDLLTIAVEAHNPERNHHRRYQVTVGRDLFGAWTVAVRWGRSGQGGRELRFASPDADAMRTVVRDRLRRRLTAPKRIGCAYRVAALNAAPGFDAGVWLPADIMAGYVDTPRSPGGPEPRRQNGCLD